VKKWGLEGVKESGLSQALAKQSLIRADLAEARLTVPAFLHTFLYRTAAHGRDLKNPPGVTDG
jgi:hypothetical protein